MLLGFVLPLRGLFVPPFEYARDNVQMQLGCPGFLAGLCQEAADL
jgi:hypothetical protein